MTLPRENYECIRSQRKAIVTFLKRWKAKRRISPRKERFEREEKRNRKMTDKRGMENGRGSEVKLINPIKYVNVENRHVKICYFPTFLSDLVHGKYRWIKSLLQWYFYLQTIIFLFLSFVSVNLIFFFSKRKRSFVTATKF